MRFRRRMLLSGCRAPAGTSAPSGHEVSESCRGTWKRRTSCGQPQATATFPAHSRAASSSATSTTVKPPRCSLDSTYGPSVNSGVPLDASTLKTGAASSRPPRKTKTPASCISALSARTALDFSRSSSTVQSGTHWPLKAMRYWVMSPPLPGALAASLRLRYERRPPDPTRRRSELAHGPGRLAGTDAFLDGPVPQCGQAAPGRQVAQVPDPASLEMQADQGGVLEGLQRFENQVLQLAAEVVGQAEQHVGVRSELQRYLGRADHPGHRVRGVRL